MGMGDIFGDIFEEFFGGGGRGRTRATSGEDLRFNLKISFEEAAFGTTTKIRVPRWERCHDCDGLGARGRDGIATCQTCHGAGQVRMQQGFFSISRTCSRCNGEGKVITDPCPTCRGRKRVERERTLSVRIPAGVETGNTIRLSGEGELGSHGGPPGDLYVFIHVQPHEFFQRQDTNIICEIPISFVQAALGDKISVPTLNGKKTLEIPKGTQPGDIFYLRGEGIPALRGRGRGDQIIQVAIKTPTHLTKKQEALLRDFAKLESKKLSNKLKNILKGNAGEAAQK